MINSVKARTPILALILFVLGIGNAFAADKVVVIPMAADKPALNIGGSNGEAALTLSTTFIMSGTDISLPVDSACVVTTTGYVTGLDDSDNVRGPYFRTARKVGVGDPTRDPVSGNYPLFVSGSSSSTSVSATYAWEMSANTTYKFGCVYIERPGNWSDDTALCRVTWVCSEN